MSIATVASQRRLLIGLIVIDRRRCTVSSSGVRIPDFRSCRPFGVSVPARRQRMHSVVFQARLSNEHRQRPSMTSHRAPDDVCPIRLLRDHLSLLIHQSHCHMPKSCAHTSNKPRKTKLIASAASGGKSRITLPRSRVPALALAAARQQNRCRSAMIATRG